VSGIDDDSASRERDAMFGGYLGGNVRFHIDGSRSSLIVKLELFSRALDNSVGTNDVCVHGVRKGIKKPLRPGPVGRDYVVPSTDAGRYDPIPCREPRRQPAGDSETDDSRSATSNCGAQSRTQSGTLIANNGHPGTARDAGFKRQTRNGNDAALSARHPHPASRQHLSQRAVSRSTLQASKKSN
jgi:hypothetical protein